MAARAGARARASSEVLAGVRSRLASGWPAGLTVLTGDDLFHLDRAQRALLDGLLPEESPEYSLTVFGEDKVDASEVVSAARSIGMFTERRIVLVREIGALDGEPDAIQAFCAAPPSNSFLLVRAPSLDRRRKLHKALVQGGELLDFVAAGAGDPRRLIADVNGLATELELKLDRDSAAFVAQACAGDLYRVNSELEKIRVWLGEGGPRAVTLDVAREITTAGGMISGWEVAEAVLLRDRPACLSSVRRVLAGGDEPLKILGGLAFRARVMLQAKAMLDSGRAAGDVVSATRSWSFKENLLLGLRRYRLEELRTFPAKLLKADRTLKSRSIDPRHVLEELVEQLTGPK